MSIQIIISSPMCYQQPSWMQPAITGSPAFQTIILGSIDADALLRVSWPGCMPDNTSQYNTSWCCQLCIGRLLSEDAMIRLGIWAWSTCRISCMTGFSGFAWLHRQRSMLGNVAHVLLSKPDSKKPPQKQHGHTSSRAGPP